MLKVACSDCESLKKELRQLREKLADLGERIVMKDIALNDLIALAERSENIATATPKNWQNFRVALEFCRRSVQYPDIP